MIDQARRPAGKTLAITGIGCVGAPGVGVEAQLAALAEGRCGLSTVEQPGLPLAARVPIGRVSAALPLVPSRTAALAVAAAREALADAGIAPERRGEVGVVVGTCTAGLPESERDFLDLGPDTASPHYRRQQAHRTTQAVARLTACGGVQSTHSVACASAAAAIIEAMELIRSGHCAAVLAVGADAMTRITMAGFTSLQLVDAEGCRPLIRERGGMSLGEGAGALLIEDPEHARRRGARPLASVLGWGLRADAYHVTSPDPSGAHLRRALDEAIADAGIDTADVGYVNAHGTGTRDNDDCETKALAGTFGTIPTASWKRTYGHSMGACAAIEAVGCCLALREQTLFPSAGADRGTPMDEVEVVRARRTAKLGVVASTTLAFGGVNAALLFGGPERCG
jgi:3-oxoacyl-(acyl-carrier-protein) synthase